MDPARVFVTGASGFLGRAVCARLAADPTLAPTPVARRPLGDGALQVADYAKLDPPAGAWIVHLAETPDIAAFEAAGEAGEAAADRTLDALLAARPDRFVYASSAAVYGDQDLHAHRPVERPEPAGRYAAMKRRHEDQVLAVGGVVLRLGNLIGPGLHGASVLGEVLAQRLRPGPIRIRDGAPERDFLPVDDAARAVQAALGVDGPAVFNIGSGRSLSVRALVDRLLAAADEPDRPVEETAPGARRSILRLDVADAAAGLGWRPETSLDAALAALVHSFQSEPGTDVR